MNQKLSWSLLIGGLVFFLGQVAELIAKHSMWGELLTPATAADFLRLLAALVPIVAGALGVTIVQADTRRERDDNRITDRHRRQLRAVVLVTAIGLVASGCALQHPAAGPIVTSPSVQQIENTRKTAIRIANATTTALGLSTQALKVADSLERIGRLTPAKLATLATAAQKFSAAARVELRTIEQVGSDPSLRASVRAILANLKPFLDELQGSDNETLRVLAASIGIAIEVVTTFQLGGD